MYLIIQFRTVSSCYAQVHKGDQILQLILCACEQVDLLHGIMSAKEYKVILDCTFMNLSEQPRLPASFRGGQSGSRDTIRLLVDKVNLNSQLLLSRTVTIIAVSINHALLELGNGTGGEFPLAHIAVSS